MALHIMAEQEVEMVGLESGVDTASGATPDLLPLTGQDFISQGSTAFKMVP